MRNCTPQDANHSDESSTPPATIPKTTAESKLSHHSAGQLLLYGLMFSVWGSSFFFTALALRSFNGSTVPVLRMILAAFALGTVVCARRLKLPKNRITWMHLAFLGAMNIAIPYVLLTRAQLHVQSSQASVLSATTPLFTFLFSWLLARAERFSLLRVLGLLIAFAGITTLYGSPPPAGESSGTWALVIVFSSAMFAAGNVYTRQFLSHVHPFVIAFLQIAFGATYLLASAWLTGTLQIGAPSLVSVVAILELGLAGSAVTYLLFFHFIQLWGSTAASLNTYFQPLIGVTLGVLALGEHLGAAGLLSLATVLCGVVTFGISSVWSVPGRPVVTTTDHRNSN